ncbi:MAG: hypothetical protein H8K04_09855 [Nitrospira sp.]
MKRLSTMMFIALAFVTPAFAEMGMEAEKCLDTRSAKQAEAQRQKNEAMAKANAAMSKHLTEAQRKALGLPPAGSPSPK